MFKKADIVKENGNTTEMVLETITMDGKATCLWFDEKGYLVTDSFNQENLVFVRHTRKK